MPGVSNSWASGDNIAHMSNRAKGHMKFSNWRSPLLWATIPVMSPEARSIYKKKRSSPRQPLRTIVVRATNRVLWLHQVKFSPNEKNMYLTSVACGVGFKRLFDDEPLQYYRNSLGILESSRGPRV